MAHLNLVIIPYFSMHLKKSFLLNHLTNISLTVLMLFIMAINGCGQNLVPNPSFEDTVSCTGTGDINDIAIWVNPTLGTPDYLNSCANGNFDVPMNAYGLQTARTGNAYVGIVSIMNSSISREYVQVQLSSPLIAGVEYCVEFYVCTSDSSTYSINNVGAYLSVNPISSSNGMELNYTPQIENPISSPINQLNIWQLVTDSFFASGGEQYLTIGNFNNNSNTDTTMINGSTWAEGYQYIDDVKVQPCSTVNINEFLLSKKLSIYPNPSNGIYNVSSEAKIQEYFIYSSVGKLIKSKKLNTQNFKLNLEEFASGIYYIKLETNNNILQKKLIIN